MFANTPRVLHFSASFIYGAILFHNGNVYTNVNSLEKKGAKVAETLIKTLEIRPKTSERVFLTLVSTILVSLEDNQSRK